MTPLWIKYGYPAIYAVALILVYTLADVHAGLWFGIGGLATSVGLWLWLRFAVPPERRGYLVCECGWQVEVTHQSDIEPQMRLHVANDHG